MPPHQLLPVFGNVDPPLTLSFIRSFIPPNIHKPLGCTCLGWALDVMKKPAQPILQASSVPNQSFQGAKSQGRGLNKEVEEQKGTKDQ